MIEPQEIENRFKYHRPYSDKAQRHDAIRKTMEMAAMHVNRACQDGREKNLAITKLEEAMMWANAAIARND